MKAAPRFLIASILAVSVAACGGSEKEQAPTGDAAAPAAQTAPETAAEAPASSAADAAPAAFAICKSCHAVEKDKHMIGPSLFGVFGTKAGDVAGYSFSAAMKASGLTWDEATLDSFLANPMKVVPGTRMTYAGQSDPAKRKEIIEYLKTLK